MGDLILVSSNLAYCSGSSRLLHFSICCSSWSMYSCMRSIYACKCSRPSSACSYRYLSNWIYYSWSLDLSGLFCRTSLSLSWMNFFSRFATSSSCYKLAILALSFWAWGIRDCLPLPVALSWRGTFEWERLLLISEPFCLALWLWWVVWVRENSSGTICASVARPCGWDRIGPPPGLINPF